ncbi:MAG TPA: ethanolamine ammonia-lyase light chain EutC, partial [Methylocystis sp.]|nr:ethanolamine ammonia-lyase light chain EutC [Methylocystis sp.]
MANLATTDPRFAAMRAATPARIGLPRAGAATATACNLAFALAHAEARDAVRAAFTPEALAAELKAQGLETIRLRSAATE